MSRTETDNLKTRRLNVGGGVNFLLMCIRLLRILALRFSPNRKGAWQNQKQLSPPSRSMFLHPPVLVLVSSTRVRRNKRSETTVARSVGLSGRCHCASLSCVCVSEAQGLLVLLLPTKGLFQAQPAAPDDISWALPPPA